MNVEDIRQLSSHEVVLRLRVLLGSKLVAYLIGADNTKAVQTLSEPGSPVPPPLVQERLRTALTAASALSEGNERTTVQSWFIGLNPALNDVSPVRYLKESAHDSEAVIHAAQSFVADPMGLPSPSAETEAAPELSPYQLCNRFALGYINEAHLVQQLTAWQYGERSITDGFDWLTVPVAGSWEEVEDALNHGLISARIYDTLLSHRSRVKGSR
jgi:hypothetical protein